jgi:hypothetical protein
MTVTTMLKATGLWKRTCQKGADYFACRLGGVKIVILENRDRATENDPSHWLYFSEPTSPAESSARRSDGARSAPSAKWSFYSPPKQPAHASGPALPGDSVDDLWPKAGP